VPAYVREVVEEIAFQARSDQKIDKRSGVSQRLPITCLENVISNAERRALRNHEEPVVARVTDVYAALPSITGKFELEYEGELRGADKVARELIRDAVANIFAGQFTNTDAHRVVEWFDLGGTLQIGDSSSAADVLKQISQVQGLIELAEHLDVKRSDPKPVVAAAVDFVLEGLYAQKKISRSDAWKYRASEQPRRPVRAAEQYSDQGVPRPGQGRKKYYN
jgi:magnesium chelatase subunit I